MTRLADETPFTDLPLGLHWGWYGGRWNLHDGGVLVGAVANCLVNFVASQNTYDLFNGERFETLEEAKAWLIAMYRMR